MKSNFKTQLMAGVVNWAIMVCFVLMVIVGVLQQ